MTPVTVRPATRADIDAFSDMANKPSVRAWCAELDGRIVGLGGLALIGGRWFAFCDLREEARPYKMTLMRTARRLFAQARRDGIRFIYAQVDDTEPGAVAWLESLGFEFDVRSDCLYRWSGK